MSDKYRHEYKYMINACQSAILESRVQSLMPKDAHLREAESYLIKSLYFDDVNDSCYFENEDGVDNRSKFRIRYYNSDLSYIRLEKKSKKRGMTLKESCEITKEIAEQLMSGTIPESVMSFSPILQGLLFEMRTRVLQPKTIVIYNRVPYIYKAGNVRITFDRNICSSHEVCRFMENDVIARPILPCGQSVLEVKWDEMLPAFIKSHMQLDELQWTSFSKYYLCRKYDLGGGVN